LAPPHSPPLHSGSAVSSGPKAKKTTGLPLSRSKKHHLPVERLPHFSVFCLNPFLSGLHLELPAPTPSTYGNSTNSTTSYRSLDSVHLVSPYFPNLPPPMGTFLKIFTADLFNLVNDTADFPSSILHNKAILGRRFDQNARSQNDTKTI
jgi:hypothetical protein